MDRIIPLLPPAPHSLFPTPRSRNHCPALLICAIAAAALLSAATASAEEWIALELYVNGEQTGEDVQAWAEAALSDRDCVSLRVYDLSADDGGTERFESICSYYKLEGAESVPLLYGCGATVRQPQNEAELNAALNDMLTVTVYVRGGCPRCARAKRFFEPMMRDYPGFEVVYRDVARDAQASREMQEVARRYQQSAVVPVFHFCNQVIVGFDRDSTTGRRLESSINHWTFTRDDMSHRTIERGNAPVQMTFPVPTPDGVQRGEAADSGKQLVERSSAGPQSFHGRLPVMFAATSLLGFSDPVETDTHSRDPPVTVDSDDVDDEPPPLPLPDPPPLPLPGPPPLPLPADESHPINDDGNDGFVPSPIADSAPDNDLVHIPFYGVVSASELVGRYGLPVFTIIIGLIDGFNPCAMWVLLFLLSILVNLKNRAKILAVAGTFVIISGLAYFAFMAAWLTFLESESIQKRLHYLETILGILAIVIGSIHVKDFFAFKKGVSFSIPEAAKPGIYARVRRIVMAENLWGAVAGASVLALLINVIELLCTAGLPMLYTGVLTRQGIAEGQKYGYLVLYNIAYMFDDGLMVAIVVYTLGKHRLQERGGRWLKLVSGVVVLALGLVLLINPELLHFEFGASSD